MSNALLAVVIGVAALVALNLTAIFVLGSSGSTVASVISAGSAPIAALIGAYFGIKTGTEAGSAGLEAAETSRRVAERRLEAAERTSLALAAAMDPDTAKATLAELGPGPGRVSFPANESGDAAAVLNESAAEEATPLTRSEPEPPDETLLTDPLS
jgi:hypothetical protein